MPRFKSYDYKQSVLLPINLEDQIHPGTLEFVIHTLVEEQVDMSVFDEKYKNDDTGRKAYDPKILLKIILLGYSRGMNTSRRIEQACRDNVVFMAMSCGQHPDHSTIAAFVSSMKEEILSISIDVLLVCDHQGLLGGTVFALDGCKLSSNASKHRSGTIDDLKRKKGKIIKKVNQLLAEQEAQDEADGVKNAEILGRDRQKQAEKLKKQADRIGKWLSENDPKIGVSGKEIKSNITDNDSAMMTTDTYGTLQGYNGQALVDAKCQVIVSAEAFGKGSDGQMLGPMVDGAKKNLEEIGYPKDYFKDKILTADSDYHSKVNLAKCDEEGLDAFIPDKRFRTRDPRFRVKKRALKKRRRFVLEDYKYNKTNDTYRCPAGSILKLNARNTISRDTIYNRYLSDREDCDNCRVRHKCFTGKGGHRRALMVPVGVTEDNLSKKMVTKIESDRGKQIYPLRMAIVEPVFGNIRIQKRLDRFTLRGKEKVNIQWLLYCLVHNIEKICNYGWAYA